MRDVRTWIRRVRRGAASLFSVLLISSPVVAYGQTVTATWDPSPPSDQITSYETCIGTASMSCNVQLASVSNTQTAYTFTPTPGVLHYVAVRAINPAGTGSYSTEASFSIPSVSQPVNQSSPVGTAITPLSMAVSDPDGSTLTYTHTGLPTGLSINSSTGQVTGTPSAAGTYNVTIFVADSLVSQSRSFVWTITAPASDTTAPALTISSHTNGQTVSSASITISGTATDSGRGGNGATVTVNGQAATGGAVTGNTTASWSRPLTLSPGANIITVQAADSRGNTATQAITVNYSIAPVTGATLIGNLASPQNTGTAITLTANGSGGVAPRQFKFLVQQSGGAAQVAQNWGTATTYTWTPAIAGTYTVTVWARSAGETVDAAQASAQMTYVINTAPPAPVTSATLTPNLASPQVVGTGITFTANGAGGVGPREFKFFVQPSGGAAQMVQNWSTATTYAWTPATATSYTVIVWARSAGVTVDAAQASAQVAYVVNPAPIAPVTSATLTPNLASPQTTGTAITFTADGSGGVAPRQFKFLVQLSGGAVQVVQNWSTATTYAWTPTTAGTYAVTVWARSAGVSVDAAQASAQMAYVVSALPVAPVTGASLVSNLASPQTAGTAVTFTANGSGGVGPREFKFFMQPSGGAAQVVQNWSTATTYTWTPATAGTYTVSVWARSAGVTVDAAQASAQMAYAVNPAPIAPVTSTTLTPIIASPQIAGTAITFRANGAGGVTLRQYKFFVQPSGGAAQVVQDWSTTATYTWIPPTAGNYIVTVWARSAGVTVDAAEASAQVPYTVTPAALDPVVVTSLTSNLATPQYVLTSVTFTGAATGGTGSYQFKFWISDGTTWTLARDWSSNPAFVWTPTIPGAYRIGVWARDATSTADVGTANYNVPFRVKGNSTSTPPPSSPTPTPTPAPAPPPPAPTTEPLVVTSLTSSLPSRQAPGTSITFTAVATGGTAPYQYKWWIFDGTTWRLARDWSTSSTFVWTPTAPDAYRIGVWVRDARTTADVGMANYSVPFRVR